MPVDAEPSPEGNLLIKDGVATVAPVGSEPRMFLSHFVTCPQRRSWRKPR